MTTNNADLSAELAEILSNYNPENTNTTNEDRVTAGEGSFIIRCPTPHRVSRQSIPANGLTWVPVPVRSPFLAREAANLTPPPTSVSPPAVTHPVVRKRILTRIDRQLESLKLLTANLGLLAKQSSWIPLSRRSTETITIVEQLIGSFKSALGAFGGCGRELKVLTRLTEEDAELETADKLLQELFPWMEWLAAHHHPSTGAHGVHVNEMVALGRAQVIDKRSELDAVREQIIASTREYKKILSPPGLPREEVRAIKRQNMEVDRVFTEISAKLLVLKHKLREDTSAEILKRVEALRPVLNQFLKLSNELLSNPRHRSHYHKIYSDDGYLQEMFEEIEACRELLEKRSSSLENGHAIGTALTSYIGLITAPLGNKVESSSEKNT